MTKKWIDEDETIWVEGSTISTIKVENAFVGVAKWARRTNTS